MSAEFDTAVRLALYREFVRTASPPTAEALAAGMQRSIAEIRAALERLAAGKAIVLQPESREILMANPLCAVPTPPRADARPFVFRVVRVGWPGNYGYASERFHIGYFLRVLWRGDDDWRAWRRDRDGEWRDPFRHTCEALVGKHRLHLKDDAALPG